MIQIFGNLLKKENRMSIMKENVKKIGIGISEKTYNHIKEVAKKEDRSISQIIRKVLNKYFKETEGK